MRFHRIFPSEQGSAQTPKPGTSFQELLNHLVLMPKFQAVTDEEMEQVKKELSEGKIDFNQLLLKTYHKGKGLENIGEENGQDVMMVEESESADEGIDPGNRGRRIRIPSSSDGASPSHEDYDVDMMAIEEEHDEGVGIEDEEQENEVHAVAVGGLINGARVPRPKNIDVHLEMTIQSMEKKLRLHDQSDN